MWQDYVMAIGNVVFIAALLPSVVGPNKPALLTSLMTALVLFTFAGTLITLDLWFTAVVTFIAAVLWAVLFVQVLRRDTTLFDRLRLFRIED